MSDIMDIGISGLLAYQTALNVASNNIANANDSDYCRREADFSQNSDGLGVNVSDISRIADAYAIQYSQASNMNFSEMNTYSTQLQGLVSLFGDDTTGIGQAITTSLKALTDLSTNASDSGGRSSYLAQMGDIAQQFQSINGQLQTNLNNVNQSFGNDTTDINQLLNNIASINAQIQTTGQNEDNSGLLDERDGLVDKLSTYLDFTTSVDSLGVMNISLSNGMSLVAASKPAQLTTIPDPSNPANMLVALEDGATNLDLSNVIKSGSIAGLYSFRQNLSQAQTSLNQLSLAFSQSFNQQNQEGIDQNGNFGGDIFSDVNSTSAINSRVMNNANNTGSGSFTVNITNVGQLQASNYQLVIGASNSYVLKRISDNTVVSSGTISSSFPQTISADGFSLNINSGTFNAGDQYIISPTNNAAATMSLALTDPSKLALALPVMTTPNSQNAGKGQLDVNSITNPENSSFATPGQLTPPIEVLFDSTGNNYSLINVTSGTTIEGPIAYDPTTGTGVNIFPTPGGFDPGYRVSIDISNGSVKPGDSFNIGYNSSSSSDFRNGTLMQKLYGSNTMNGGTSTFNSAYDSLTNAIFSEGENAQNQSDIAQKLKTSADTARDQISGVSVPEESMNIERFQEAYQASAQVLQAAKASFDAILGLFGSSPI